MKRRRSRRGRAASRSGFILLPVALALGLIASIAYLSNRDSGTNVAMVSSRNDVEKARYAAEGGLHRANYGVRQLDCARDLNSTFTGEIGGASYTAGATEAVPASAPRILSLSATGSYNGTTVTLKRDKVVSYRRDVVNLTVQQGANDVTDTYIEDERPPGTSHATADTLPLRTHSNHVYQVLIRFNLPLIHPASRLVDRYKADGSRSPGAEMSLRQSNNASGSNDVTVVATHLPRAAWTDKATWSNTGEGSNAWPAQKYDPVPVATRTTSDEIGWKDWDITNAASAWVADPNSNRGLWLIASGSTKQANYVSSEGAVAADRPKLVLNFLQPCP